jgi:hypothetical protein
MRARAVGLAFLATMSLGLPGCSDDPVSPSLPVTFSGTIQVMNGTSVPANARVLVFWGVSATSPDYTYVWGSGTLGTNGAFSITFDEEPPAAALNMNELGVGLVVLTTDQNLQEGVLSASFDRNTVIGMSEDHSIIFTKNLDAALLAEVDWPGRFNGYGLGEVERNDAGFDSFRSVARDALRLIVDDLVNLNPPNWT